MKLFNKTIDRQLFKQYSLGSDLSKQEVVVKIFNPQGAQSWYILNSDPQDPDYLWAIVDLGYGAEIGSVSRNDLESYRGRFGLGFERDLGFDPINAEELYNGLRQGKFYADGGLITEDKLKEEEWFSPDMKIMYQYRNGRLGITLFYGKDRRYSEKTVINNASELSIKELNSRVKEEIIELKQFAKEMLENNFADGGNLSRDRKFVNHSQDYEVEYSKGKDRHGYGFADGGNIESFSDNQRMIMNQNVQLEHHHEELEDILEDKVPVPAWVVAKMATATDSVSDVTHYLDGQKELMEDEDEDDNEEIEDEDEDEEEDEDEILNKEVVEPINVSAGTKAEMTKKFTDDALGNLKGFLKGMEGVELRDDYTFDYKDEQYEIEPIINSDENGVSNAVFTIFDGDGEEVGEVAYSREGGKQKFTANSEFFSWNNTKFEDGGFMNGVYADGGYFDGTIPKVSTYMSNYADGGNTAINNLNKNTDTRENMISYIVNMKSTSRMSDKQYDALEERISQKSFAQLKKEYDTLKANSSYANGGSLSEKEQILEALENYDSEDNEFEEDQQFFVTDDLLGFIRGLKVSDKESIVLALSDYDGDDFIVTSPLLSFVENINVNGNYAKGGEIAKAEVFGLKRNVMGTTDIEMKITGMRKAQDFIVYPIGKDDAGNVITIQSDTRIGQINLVKGVGVMSQSHSSGAYFVHLQMDKLTSFTMSESDLENLKAFINKTAGSNVGTRGVVTDNAGASGVYAKGGVTYYNDENQHRLGRPSGSFEKEIYAKVKDRIDADDFVGSFGWRIDSGKKANIADGFLYKLDDYDQNLIKDLKLKQGEKVFRYVNRTTAIGGMIPFIKINIEKALLYFPVSNDNDDIIFETRGVTPLWINLIEGSFADGGINNKYNDKDALNILNYFSFESIDDHNEQYVQEWFDNSGLKKNNYNDKDILNILNYFSVESMDNHNEQYVEEWFARSGLKKMADGGFMADVYADGCQVRVGDKYKNEWTDSKNNSGYDIIEIKKQNVTSGKDFKTKVMITEVVQSSLPERIGMKQEEYKPNFKKLIELGLYRPLHERMNLMEREYAKGGTLNQDDVKIGDWLQKKENNVKAKVFDIKKDRFSTDIFVQDPHGNKVSRPIYLEGWKKTTEPTRELARIEKFRKENVTYNTYANGGNFEKNDGYNLKDINGKKIKVGDRVKTTQPSGGVMNPANPETGIVEKTKDAFGNDALQIRYRKSGKNYDQLILLNGKINEIIDKSSSSFEQGGFMNGVYADGGDVTTENYEKRLQYLKMMKNNERTNFGKYNIDKEIREINTILEHRGNLKNSYAKGGSLEDKLTKLENKKSDLESKLFDAQLIANEKWNNMGWGSGMRKSKLNLSTSREDSLKERIKVVEKEIEQTKEDMLPKKPKYILKADIKTVTVKRNGKEVTYKGADVLNGANVLAEGGDISSKANYIPKRDVVGVELKDGTTVKPVNGYWVKKGAEPIGNEPTPAISVKSETKVGQTFIKKGVYGWSATTTINDFNNYDWKVSTHKTSRGELITTAQGGKFQKGDGYTTFKFMMYEDPFHTLEVSKPSRLTEKVVAEQHAKGLAKFKKFMETGMFKGGGKISNFDKLSAKVAKQYEGKPVKNQYQEEYGKFYSKEEAQEVGDKVAGKVKAMQGDNKAFGGLFSGVKKMTTPSQKYPNLEGKQVSLKTGEFVEVFTQSGSKLSVIEVGKIGSGVKPYTIDISEVDEKSFKMGGETEIKKSNGSRETFKKANELAKKIRMDGESWLDAKKRAFAQLKK